MIRRPPRSTQSRSSAASDVYKRQTVFSISLVLRHPGGSPAGVITQHGPAHDDGHAHSVAGVRSKWRTTSHVFRRACGSTHPLIPSKGIGVQWAVRRLSLIHISEPTRLGM